MYALMVHQILFQVPDRSKSRLSPPSPKAFLIVRNRYHSLKDVDLTASVIDGECLSEEPSLHSNMIIARPTETKLVRFISKEIILLSESKMHVISNNDCF